MAAVFTHPSTGGLVSFRKTREEERRQPVPAGAVVVRFDTRANADVFRDLQRHTNAYSIVSGELRKNDQVVQINPSPLRSQHRDEQAMSALRIKLLAAVAVLDNEDVRLIGRLLLRLYGDLDD